MDDDPAAVEDDERTIELSSIAAIYPELVVDPSDPYTATLDLSVSPIKPLRILFGAPADGLPPNLSRTAPTLRDKEQNGHTPDIATIQDVHLDAHDLTHLPPLSLRITLPEGYPTTKPPVISVSVSPQWLSRPIVKKLKDDCATIWEELGQDQVVYAYIDHVQQEAEHAFGLAEEPYVQLSSELKLALMDFDLKTKREKFEAGTFDCGICLEPKKGTHCHRLLLCGHVFCVACLQDFYKSCITEGDVDNVKCLSPTCGAEEHAKTGPGGRPLKRRKQDRTLNPSELLQIPIEQDLVQRYVRLKRKKRLESDKNTIYCPRQWCQGAAKSKKHPKPIDPMNYAADEETSESEEELEETTASRKKTKSKDRDPESLPMSERLSVCEDCDFAFCCVCRKGWHGELARCSPRRQQELNEEEKASVEYLQKYSTPCPTCNAPAQKTMGCNHMVCFKCKTHFCYLCSSYLMPDNPYSHFNDPKGGCYMRLWVLEAGDGEDVGRDVFHNPELAEWDEEGDESESDSDDDLPPENFDAFGGDHGRPFDDEEDTSDEEPAPDQRRHRQMHIEIVNFARPGGQNPQRFELPERPRAGGPAAPPPAPNPPRPRARAGQRRRHHAQQQAMRNNPARAPQGQPGGQPAAPAHAPRPHGLIHDGAVPPPPADVDNDNPHRADVDGLLPPAVAAQLPLAAPGQGNHPGAAMQQAGPVRAMGLERFLQLAQQDQEDEWDSDELEEGGFDDGDDFHDRREHERMAHAPRRRRAVRGEMGWP